jgi:hypothetical protein
VAGAGRRLLAPFGRESAAGQFVGAYTDLHARAVIFPEVPDVVRALDRHTVGLSVSYSTASAIDAPSALSDPWQLFLLTAASA